RSRRLIPYALSSIPQGESGIDGVARIRPEAASGGMGANHGYSCARHPRSRVRFAYPGYAATARPVAPAEPEPLTPRSPQRERGSEGGARIRPKAASGDMGATTDARAHDILVPGFDRTQACISPEGKESARNRGWEPRRKRPAQGRPQWLEAVKAQPARSTTSNPAIGSTSAS